MSIVNHGHGTGGGFQQQPEAQMQNQGTVDQTLAQRAKTYGDFSVHAQICQETKRVWMQIGNWNRLTDVQKQALDVIADKVSRILSGDPEYQDNWHDIQGYAKLAEARLRINSGKSTIAGNAIGQQAGDFRRDVLGRRE